MMKDNKNIRNYKLDIIFFWSAHPTYTSSDISSADFSLLPTFKSLHCTPPTMASQSFSQMSQRTEDYFGSSQSQRGASQDFAFTDFPNTQGSDAFSFSYDFDSKRCNTLNSLPYAGHLFHRIPRSLVLPIPYPVPAFPSYHESLVPPFCCVQ